MLERDVQRQILAPVIAAAGGEIDPPAGEQVQCRPLLGDPDRMMQRQHGGGGRKADAFRPRRAAKAHDHLRPQLEFEMLPWLMKKPVIASVQGHVMGGGCELVMLCDLTIAADNATFGEPGDERTLTYRELYAEVNRAAQMLRNLGLKKGDRVAIYMPMIPELPIAMLACARIGAVHGVVFGGFSSEALRDRILHA